MRHDNIEEFECDEEYWKRKFADFAEKERYLDRLVSIIVHFALMTEPLSLQCGTPEQTCFFWDGMRRFYDYEVAISSDCNVEEIIAQLSSSIDFLGRLVSIKPVLVDAKVIHCSDGHALHFAISLI